MIVILIYCRLMLFRQRELNVTMLEANIQHLKSSTRYVIHVFAFNSYGFSETAARLAVQTKTEGRTIIQFVLIHVC